MTNFRYLTRFQADGESRHGVSDGQLLIDLSKKYQSWSALLAAATVGGLDESALDGERIDISSVRQLAPYAANSRTFAVALNYRSHIEEVGREPPEAPLIFMIPNSAIIDPNAEIRAIDRCEFLDYEAELAVVIGREASRIVPDEAYAVVAGVTLFNDVTGRDLLFPNPAKRGIPDWLSAKGLDESTPVGPSVYRPEAISDIDHCVFRMDLNGERVQEGRPDDRVFSIQELLSFLSHRVTLQPGDILATGTPTGTGKGRGVPLAPGDLLEVSSGEIGCLRNRVAGRLGSN